MISRHLADCWGYLENVIDNSYQAIFTDPPYDKWFDVAELRRVCDGPIVMFCAPRKPFFKSTHLAYWFKQPAPKIVSKQIQSSNVEWILIDCQPGMYYNPGLFWANYI